MSCLTIGMKLFALCLSILKGTLNRQVGVSFLHSRKNPQTTRVQRKQWLKKMLLLKMPTQEVVVKVISLNIDSNVNVEGKGKTSSLNMADKAPEKLEQEQLDELDHI